jgi:uncharacterized LabA/DUF88 family protein
MDIVMQEMMPPHIELIVVDGPNLYNSVARCLARETDQVSARDYLKRYFDIDRFTIATIRRSNIDRYVIPRLGIVIFHSARRLGSDKTVKLMDREVTDFWARQGAIPFCSTELVALPGTQEELTEAVCPTCDETILCQKCHQPARVAERREKGVDTSITTYLLETADRWDSVCIISGDVDFVPPVRSLKRRGKQVFCAVEPGSGHRDLTQVCTSHFELNIDFLRKDLERFKVLKPNGGLDAVLESLRTAGATRQICSWFVRDDNLTVGIAFVPPPDVSLQDLRQKISCRLTPMEVSKIQNPRPSPLKESELSSGH